MVQNEAGMNEELLCLLTSPSINGPMSREVLKHDQSKSECFQIQSYACCDDVSFFPLLKQSMFYRFFVNYR